MGTSKGYGGPANGLVPTWIDDVTPGAGAAPASPENDGQGTEGQIPHTDGPQTPSPAASPAPQSLGGARGNFTRFVRNGDRAALRRAVSQYVRQGAGGAQGAARRMGTSRAVGSQLLGVFRDVQRDGATAVLQRLNLGALVGRPAAEVFIALTEVICPPGGRVDEAIARQAMLETIGDLAETGVGDFGAMSADEMNEFFIGFVIHTIEGRVMADLGQRAIELPTSVADVESIQEQLHDFVDGNVRGHLGHLVEGLPGISDGEIGKVVDRIYEASFELVSATAGDVK